MTFPWSLSFISSFISHFGIWKPCMLNDYMMYDMKMIILIMKILKCFYSVLQFQFVNSYLSLFYIGFYLKDMERLKEVRIRIRIDKRLWVCDFSQHLFWYCSGWNASFYGEIFHYVSSHSFPPRYICLTLLCCLFFFWLLQNICSTPFSSVAATQEQCDVSPSTSVRQLVDSLTEIEKKLVVDVMNE